MVYNQEVHFLAERLSQLLKEDYHIKNLSLVIWILHFSEMILGEVKNPYLPIRPEIDFIVEDKNVVFIDDVCIPEEVLRLH